MKQTRDILMTIFWLQLIIPALLYVGCEFFSLDLALLSDTQPQVRYVVSTVMILLTLAMVPVALRLFKLHRVSDDLLMRKAEALRKWGLLRLVILGDLLVANTLLYYVFGFEPAFGYLAVVVLLTLPFVYPTMNRCLAEVEPNDEDVAEEKEETAS